MLYDVATQKLDAQFATADAIDAKAATIFSVASTVAAIVPALLPLGRANLDFQSPAVWLLISGGIFYVGTAILFGLTYWPGEWQSGPDIEELKRICGFGEEYARRWAADAYTLSIELNAATVEKKARYLTRSMIAFTLEVVLLVAAAISTFAQ